MLSWLCMNTVVLAVRKLNLMLDTIPREARKRLLFTKEMLATMSALGKQILEVGDYDLQVAITEALCRMTSEAQRRELANQWFPMEFVTKAFKEIQDAEFETDCRKFLNLVNGMLGNRRRVFTYPCISAYLDHHKFQTPSDEKLEEFWIDFNVGTQSISFYVSTDDNESHQWETVCITESEVDIYNVEDINNKRLLTVSLKSPTTVGQIKGCQIRIYFDPALDISEVVRKVFGASKCKGFIKKRSVSVAKTAVHIVFDESGSQILIPESQGSFSSAKEVKVIDTGDVGMNKQPSLSTPSLNQQVCKENRSRDPAKLVTPSRSKVSEASINISVACGVKKVNSSSKKSTSRRERIKVPLEMISSAKRNMNPIPNIQEYTRHTNQIASLKKCTTYNKGTVQSKEDDANLSKGDEQVEVVPDTQFTVGNNSFLLPNLTEKYLGLNKKHPMSTRQREKISLSGDCTTNKDKQQTVCSIPEGKKATQTQITRVVNNQKTRTQSHDSCQNTRLENRIRTELRDKNGNRFSITETTIGKSIQNSDIHLQPKNERTKNEITDVEKFKNSRTITKEKVKQKNVNEKNNFKDVTKTLVSKIGNKYSKEAVKSRPADTSLRMYIFIKISLKKKAGSLKVD
ncbi:synaptonemal complex protein 2-like [Leptodactylus fuscus]